MALAAACFETDGSVAERLALKWLEQQSPPELYAATGQPREIVTAFVPVNDAAAPRLGAGKSYSESQVHAGIALMPDRRVRQPRHFPAVIPDDPVVHLCWPLGNPEADIRDALATLGGKVTYIGHSASLVQVWVDDHPPETNWIPAERPNGQRLRVSGPGRLAYLESQFNAVGIEAYWTLSDEITEAKGKRKAELKQQLVEKFGDAPPQSRRPSPSLWQVYSPKETVQLATAEPHSIFDDNLIVLRRIGGRQFGLESTLQIATALRDTIMSQCPQQPVPEWMSGHKPDGTPSEKPHLAFIPLANVGFEHSDGRLLGAAIAVPRSVGPAEMKLLSPLTGYDQDGQPLPIKLTFGELGEWTLQVEDRDSVPLTLQQSIWTGPARRWATVTPIVFDRHPRSTGDSKWAEIETMIADACERIGLPRPKDVVLSSVSMFSGSPHARRMLVMQRKTGGSLHHTHAIVTFDTRVVGPVLLGTGRYRGYGLLRPLSPEENR
jgi:CRISPR-associated protein Csb2